MQGESKGRLTAEQLRLLELLATGISVAKAARALHLSPRTAERRLAEARQLLAARTTAEALLRASGRELVCDEEQLTRREHEVLELVAEGLRNDAIAKRLGIAPSTVAALLRSAMAKLDVKTRAQAAARLAGINDGDRHSVH